MPMQTYLVGGAVRDELLGRAAGDRDWVVVGATPAQMLAAGYLPVGRDFPVFLHPQTREEYALARTERKTSRGYHGFAFQTGEGVSLEDDLARRDLTINAMARDGEGRLVDPWGGARDLADQRLRHVSAAFSEDPVRILRLARFAARWPDFHVAHETMALCRHMVALGEVDALVPERVWQELARGLMERRPSRMIEVLRDCGALARLLPEVEALFGVPQRADYHPEVDTGLHTLMVVDMAARLHSTLPVRWAALTHDLGKATTPAHVLPRHLGHEQRSLDLLGPLSQRLRVPVDCQGLAELVAREHGHVHRCADLGPAALVRLLDRCDAWRRPDRFEQMLQACECDARGRGGFEEQAYPQADRLRAAFAGARAVDSAAVARAVMAAGQSGPAVGRALHAARCDAVAREIGRVNPPQEAPAG